MNRFVRIVKESDKNLINKYSTSTKIHVNFVSVGGAAHLEGLGAEFLRRFFYFSYCIVR